MQEKLPAAATMLEVFAQDERRVILRNIPFSDAWWKRLSVHNEGAFSRTKDKGLMALDALNGVFVDKPMGKWMDF